ncbi:N-acetylmuramoyl-L-alanine amidase [Thermogemmatispora sp.]|uniref:N-acetylmuramoyl-L-alanine amidase n=1 Tax=Thermogemmatispora sp. TaxID=1968838 RepID=UPI001E1608EA|nr:peptidoglycan recognition family protein [Thermogemmatispora sp.]MBX5448692.1 N-acetylmuramoyl-L-alanine amidase [Thermogemmatispora sp.]
MDEPGALWCPSPNYFPGRRGQRPRWIIVHGTAGFASAEEVVAFFQHPETEASTHYVIGRDGRIFQLVREADAAWGNGVVSRGHDRWWEPLGNPNYVTLSIEHHKLRRDNGDELTAAQKRASFLLIAHLCERHGIPRRWADAQGGITGHFSLDPEGRSYCPGPYPWDELFSYLAGSDPPHQMGPARSRAAEQTLSDRDPTGAGLRQQLAELREVAAAFQRRLINVELELARLQGQERPPGSRTIKRSPRR